jgi:hypothetical protein
MKYSMRCKEVIKFPGAKHSVIRFALKIELISNTRPYYSNAPEMSSKYKDPAKAESREYLVGALSD